MEEWKEYKLGDVVNILDSKRVPLSSKERSTRQGCYPYYGAQGIIDYIDDFIFDGTYLLIAEDGENLKSQKQNVAQLASGKYWVNNHAHILESNGKSDIRYICYLLNTLDLSGYITGSAQPKLNQANLIKIAFKLPPLEIQKDIADYLSVFDDKIEVNRKTNENLEQQAQALFKSWFVDFEPFKNGDFVESELGRIPKGWRVVELADACTIKYGKGLGKNDLTQKGFPVFGGNGIIGFYTQYLYNLPQILVSCRGAASGKIIESLPQSYVTSNSLVLELKDRFYYNYLKFFLLSKPLYDYATGSAQPQITIDNIKGVKVLLPHQEVIQKMDPILKFIGNTQRNNEFKSRCLAELRDTLLPKLMSGELNVFDKPNDQS